MSRRPIELLIVDDEEDIRNVIRERFDDRHEHPSVCSSASEALALARQKYFDIGIFDIKMPGTDGLELYRQLREIQPEMEVLFLTGHASVDTALEAMKLGAYDYMTKPVELAELEILVGKAFEKRQLRKQTILLREELARRGAKGSIVGMSGTLERVLHMAHQVAMTDTPVLIEGETGVGKELIAQEVHDSSPRRDNPLIAVNCGALQDTLVENELFGHEKGAFTGAVGFKRGLFEAADAGTLFIDEIGEMNIAAQTKLLRVLEAGTFRRLGDTRETHVDVRVICATNRDLEDEVRKGRFREDLFYRLGVFRIEVPPLRERKEDIPLLAYHFLQHGRAAGTGTPREIRPEALVVMTAHSWPGNVRELANAVEYASILARGKKSIEVMDLPAAVRRSNAAIPGKAAAPVQLPEPAPPLPEPPVFSRPPPNKESEEPLASPAPQHPPSPAAPPAGPPAPHPYASLSLAEIEKLHILEALQVASGNRTRAATVLGISVRHMRRKLKEYGYQD